MNTVSARLSEEDEVEDYAAWEEASEHEVDVICKIVCWFVNVSKKVVALVYLELLRVCAQTLLSTYISNRARYIVFNRCSELLIT